MTRIAEGGDGNAHPGEERLAAFILDGMMGRREMAGNIRIARHLARCPPCRDRAVEYLSLGRAVEGLPGEAAVRWHQFETPFGALSAAAGGRGLLRLSWSHARSGSFVEELEDRFPNRPVIRDPVGLKEVEEELFAYFRGNLRELDLPVDLGRTASFQRQILEAARKIPYGEVWTYSRVAREAGRPRAARAAGQALAGNPVAVVVPCHRVVRSDGGLGGYSSGRTELKEELLRLEGALDPRVG